tara:strand:- start:686 stop:865 length:180 start_codon:yes stop_codon:yes gene_type:complete
MSKVSITVYAVCREEFCEGALIVVDGTLKCRECGDVVVLNYRPLVKKNTKDHFKGAAFL